MKVERKHFELFKKECLRWIDRCHLDSYRIEFKHEKLEKDRANCSYGVVNRWAVFRLNTEWSDISVDMAGIKRIAKHEVMHLLIGRLSAYASSRYITEDEINEADEELTRKLEKLIT